MITRHTHYSLLSHNTFGINVEADLFLEYSSVDELVTILSESDLPSKPFLHIGGGSNLLFECDYRGTILHSAIKGIEVVEDSTDHVKVRVGAGVVWDDFVAWCVGRDLAGAENLSLIPGEVGASVVQNIGAYGVEIKDIADRVEAVEIKSCKKRVFTNSECSFSYRHSIFKAELKNQYIVTHVVYRLRKDATYNLEYGTIKQELLKYGEVNLSTIRQAIIDIRQSKLPDPEIEGNAGSFFMNPVIPRKQFERLKSMFPTIPHYEVDAERVKIPAAWMIDSCGWKGKGLGNAGVHDKQALVLVNKGGATGAEIINLSKAIQASVREKFGVEIRPEVNFIGDCI